MVRLLESNEALVDRISIMERSAMSSISLKGQDSASLLQEGFTRDTIVRSSNSDSSNESGQYVLGLRAFEEDLNTSWVYQRSLLRGPRTFSIATSTQLTQSWSMLSGLSLSGISNIAIQALPIFKEDLANSELYTFGGKTPTINNAANANLPLSEASFEDNPAEIRKISLATNLIRSTSTRISNDSKELKQHFTLTRLEKGLVTERRYLSSDGTDIKKLNISQPTPIPLTYNPFMRKSKMAKQDHGLATVEESPRLPYTPLTGSYNFFDSDSGLYKHPYRDTHDSTIPFPLPEIPVMCSALSRVGFGDRIANITIVCPDYCSCRSGWPYLTYESDKVKPILLARRSSLITF